MKILVISSHEQQYGGGEGRVAFEFAVEMSKRHRVVLMYPGTVPESLPAGARLEVYPIRSIDFTVPALTGGEIRAVFRFLDSFQPDVIHSHTPWVLGAIIQAWAFVKGVPFYFTAHELLSKILEWGLVRYLKGMSRTGLLHVLTRTYLATFCRHCTAVVALNQPAARDIRSIGYRGKLHVIPNGRTLSDYNGSGPADIHQPEKILTFTGDFYPRKNQKYLVEMLAHLPSQYKLLLVGHDVDHQYRREIDAAMGPEVRGRVVFTGKLDHSRIPEQLARTHLWVSASRMEVQSLSVLEALASGTPVLGLSNETIDELVDSRVGMRLPKSTTPEEFARAVQSLCETDGESYRGMCHDARRRVAHYDWSNNVHLTEGMYAGASPRGGRNPRGVLPLPLLFAAGQMIIAMIMYLILQIMNLLERFPHPRVVRVAVRSTWSASTPGPGARGRP
jgi:glycosyltransferase involved in cell wall biosynthesis